MTKYQYILSDYNLNVQIGDYECQISQFKCLDNRLSCTDHRHDGIELHLNVKGSIEFNINETEKYIVGDKTYVILGKNVLHNEIIITSPVNAQSYCMNFSFKKLNTKIRNNYSIKESENLFEILEKMTYSMGTYDDKIKKLFDDIIFEAQNHQLGHYTKIQYLLGELIIEIVRYYTLGKEAEFSLPLKKPSDRKLDIISDFFQNIYFGFSSDYSIEALAEQLFLSKRQVNRLSKTYYNMTFAQKLDDTLIKRARELLLTKSYSVAVISEMCGFTDEKYFSVKFKKLTGSSPSAYRKHANQRIR